jgi:hypothetical protein
MPEAGCADFRADSSALYNPGSCGQSGRMAEPNDPTAVDVLPSPEQLGSGARLGLAGGGALVSLAPVTVRLLKLVAQQRGVAVDVLVSQAVNDMLVRRMSAFDPAILAAIADNLAPLDSRSADLYQVAAEMAEFETAIDGHDPTEGVLRPKLP